MRLCHGKDNYTYIINDHGDIVASGENALVCYCSFCRNHTDRPPLTVENGRLFYDIEHDKYYPESVLSAEFDGKSDDEQEAYNYDFSAYIRECTGKNGILEEV